MLCTTDRHVIALNNSKSKIPSQTFFPIGATTKLLYHRLALSLHLLALLLQRLNLHLQVLPVVALLEQVRLEVIH